MTTRKKFILWGALIVVPLAIVFAAGSTSYVTSKKDGLHICTKKTDKLAFYDLAVAIPQPPKTKTTREALEGLGLIEKGGDPEPVSVEGFYETDPIEKPAGAAQANITDNTTGTSGAAAAAGTGVQTIALPLQYASMTTAAADLVTNYTPGYKFKLLQVDLVTTTIGAGAAASQTINVEIGTTNVTGGVVAATEAGTDTLGEITAGTAVTAANTGTAADTLSVEVAASGTVFTAGNGILLIKLQNMDTADAHASELARINKLRDDLVALGLIKGET